MSPIQTLLQHKSQLYAYDFDIGKCINYFIESLWFDGAVVYRDKPWFQLAFHYHNSDDYIYILEGELIIEMDGSTKKYSKGDFCIIEKWRVHAVKPWSGWKYIVASEDGDFETIFL